MLGIVIFAGLPILGWGLGDIRSFVSLPARLSYVAAVLLVHVLTMIKFPGTGTGRGEGVDTIHRQRWAVSLLQVLSPIVLLTAGYTDRDAILPLADSDASRYLGVLLFALGLLMVTAAESALGRQFSVHVSIHEGHRLVTGGLCRYIRHPRYLGILAFMTGVSLVFNSWAALAVVALLAMVLLWRIGDEETLMHAWFGSEWEDYRAHTWRLIPFVF